MAIRGLETGKNFIVFQHPLLIIFVPVVLGLYSCLVKNAQTLLLLRCHWTSKSSSAATVKKLQSVIPVSVFFRPIVNSTASSNARPFSKGNADRDWGRSFITAGFFKVYLGAIPMANYSNLKPPHYTPDLLVVYRREGSLLKAHTATAP
jgi:hypothetical protein